MVVPRVSCFKKFCEYWECIKCLAILMNVWKGLVANLAVFFERSEKRYSNAMNSYIDLGGESCIWVHQGWDLLILITCKHKSWVERQVTLYIDSCLLFLAYMHVNFSIQITYSHASRMVIHGSTKPQIASWNILFLLIEVNFFLWSSIVHGADCKSFGLHFMEWGWPWVNGCCY